jgi:hypothetical protein
MVKNQDVSLTVPLPVARLMLRLCWAGYYSRPELSRENPAAAIEARDWLLRATERFVIGAS